MPASGKEEREEDGAEPGRVGTSSGQVSQSSSEEALMRRSQELRKKLLQSALYRPSLSVTANSPAAAEETSRPCVKLAPPVTLVPAPKKVALSARNTMKPVPLTLKQLAAMARAGTVAEQAKFVSPVTSVDTSASCTQARNGQQGAQAQAEASSSKLLAARLATAREELAGVHTRSNETVAEDAESVKSEEVDDVNWRRDGAQCAEATGDSSAGGRSLSALNVDTDAFAPLLSGTPPRNHASATPSTKASSEKRNHASGSSAIPNPPAKRGRVTDDAVLIAGWQSLLEHTRRHPEYGNEYTRLFEVDGASWLKASPGPSRLAVGIDCEMVYAKDDPNALARVSVVSFSDTVLDLYVERSCGDILDFRTPISGVKPHHLLQENGALPFSEIQQRVLKLISPDTILVGHALQNDLRALQIQHNTIVDTALLFAVDGGGPWQKHKLHSLVSLMRAKVATLETVSDKSAHDSRQDATWALEIALYEASIFPRRTGPLKLETFPTRVILTEIPPGFGEAELQALFRSGEVSEVEYQLQCDPPGDWLGRATVSFPNQSDRDAAFAALARFICVRVGPLHDWRTRRDVEQMQAELVEHFAHYGKVRGCRVMWPRPHPGLVSFPFALLDCHPATARTLVTKGKTHCLATHASSFAVHLADDDHCRRRCVVPIGSSHLVARVQ